MRYVTIFIIILLVSVSVVAQRTEYSSFTVNEGLPSNHIYQCVEDNKGFLWIATDGGVARFDGKYFQIFTTANGLPDNEVLHIVKEKSGRIWVNCHKQSPAYFDEVKNRFINSTENTDLAKVSGTINMTLYALPEDGVQFNNEKGSFVFRNTKLDTLNSIVGFPYYRLRSELNDFQFGIGKSFNKLNNFINIYLLSKKNIKDSLPFKEPKENYLNRSFDNNKYYSFNSSKQTCFIYSIQSTNPFKVKVDSIKISEEFTSCGFNDTTIFFVCISGKIEVHHKETFKKLYSIKGNFLANRLYEDSKGNIWIATVDKGLIIYRPKKIEKEKIPEAYTNNNFLSIARYRNKTLAGNYYGEVVELNKDQFNIHRIINRKPSRQRKIIITEKDIYTVSEDGVFVNYKSSFINPSNQLILGGKTGLLYNDTTLLIGSFAGVLHINPKSRQVTASVRFKRGMTLAKGKDGFVYYGSTDGLYRYDVLKQSFEDLRIIDTSLSQRIIGITITEDGLVWVANANGSVVLLKNKKVILSINLKNGLVSGLLRTITSGKERQVWVGTSHGISIINYHWQNQKIVYKIQNITKNDGLVSNEINEMVLDKDTMYAATSNGISIIPTKLLTNQFDIPTQLVKISINQLDTTISDDYKLKSNTQNIQMQFSGIDLNGYFERFQYRIFPNQIWQTIIGTTLNLQLNSGKHQLEIRAIDTNGYVSKQIKRIQFEIATPFWKTIWFWILIGLTLQLFLIVAISRWQKKRKESQLAKSIATVQTAALEQQAFTSLMNPHFMFNALNSIQHYINVQDRTNANRYLSDFASLLRKSFEAAQKYFIPLEEELEHLRIYLRLEQMRFSDRFNYNITIAPNLDTEKWMIPTMMLQPLLENAILHGIMPSNKQGELFIELEESKKSLIITIIDNGIGIENSRKLQGESHHNSRGTELIQKRIDALLHFGNTPITLSTSEAQTNETNPGVKITLMIPGDLYTYWLKASQF